MDTGSVIAILDDAREMLYGAMEVADDRTTDSLVRIRESMDALLHRIKTEREQLGHEAGHPTYAWDEHPEGYEDECYCKSCREYAN
jgi:hypothetical protein